MLTSISGFPEFRPEEQIVFNRFKEIIAHNYERAGAVPIETPAVEKIETLKKKANDENLKQMYVISQMHGENKGQPAKLGLHFDLTLPFARYVTDYAGHLTFPFRRYQIQPVWRGERAQKGRFRQFYQCDIDVVGENKLSLVNDADVIQIIVNTFNELKIGDFIVELNNRKVLIGFFEGLGLTDEALINKAIKVVDDFEKVELSSIRERLEAFSLEGSQIDQVLNFVQFKGDVEETLAFLRSIEGNGTFKVGVDELEEVIGYLQMFKVDPGNYQINLKIARGLDYYSSSIFETRLKKYPGIGSICSGGRYDHLTEQLGSKKVYPGVGISIGLTRLVDKLLEAGIVKTVKPTVAPVLITTMAQSCLAQYLEMGAELRNNGINTEVYTENKKLSAQMKYANRKGFDYVVIASEEELAKGTVMVRCMNDGEQWHFDISGWVKALTTLISQQE